MGPQGLDLILTQHQYTSCGWWAGLWACGIEEGRPLVWGAALCRGGAPEQAPPMFIWEPRLRDCDLRAQLGVVGNTQGTGPPDFTAQSRGWGHHFARGLWGTAAGAPVCAAPSLVDGA